MKKPNIIVIMTDDHAAHAMSCYGSKINTTPNMDRIANEGIRFDNCFCTNSICAPSRAVILTGKHNHLNGVRTLSDGFDSTQMTFPKLLKKSGYQTAMIGKWHLGEEKENWPTGFDRWCVFPGQGDYFNPVMNDMGENKVFEGYATDIVTDLSLDWMESRDKEKPFCLLCYHKAPHRPWEPDAKHAHMYDDVDIPMPDTFNDTYENRSNAAKRANMRVVSDMDSVDLKLQPPENIKDYGTTMPGCEHLRDKFNADSFRIPLPESVENYSLTTENGEIVTFNSLDELKNWKYQRYIKDYLRCVASVDDNVGRLLDYLDEESLTNDTIVIYTSDQGFFLGDHGWFDKRFMYEESLRMPFVVRYPKGIKAGIVCKDMALNLDFAETFLDYAGVDIPAEMQGKSLRPLFEEKTPEDWRTGMYYRYWMHLTHHNVASHYGIRTDKYKLIYYYGEALDATEALDMPTEPEWELFDLEKDPCEMFNVYDDLEYKDIVDKLKTELYKLKEEAEDYK
ncbi:sulfatase family protein [Clostridium grantii]|uniref:Arylsulfatase A n=1 Tax=Clostridium grantii DSM 8605 TaxID=1121316 RepID=A0A1M5U251_9CLOT|nr:sulfatase [Clostridium grantii]SHH57034.1 Arylsulfatase A [Clostridium grantii DSM 8605]